MSSFQSIIRLTGLVAQSIIKLTKQLVRYSVSLLNTKSNELLFSDLKNIDFHGAEAPPIFAVKMALF